MQSLKKTSQAKKIYRKRLHKTEPQYECHSVEQIVVHWLEKIFALYLVCGQSQDKWTKAKKGTFWLSVHFLMKILKKSFSLTILLHSSCSCNRFDTLFWNQALKKAPTFIHSIKGFEIFFRFSTCSKKLTQTLDTCGQHRPSVSISFLWMKDPTNLILIIYLWFYSVQKILVFCFCSCSKLLQLKFAKTKLHRNRICSAPKIVTSVTRIANEIYLPYLQLCGKASMWMFMYFRCKSGSIKFKQKLRLRSGQ